MIITNHVITRDVTIISGFIKFTLFVDYYVITMWAKNDSAKQGLNIRSFER